MTLIFIGPLLQEMGFSRYQAEEAIKKFSTVQGALDSLLAGVGRWKYLVCLSYCGIIIICGDSVFIDMWTPLTHKLYIHTELRK